ncbi:hypothetical protein SAMN02745163_01200 [Clostridium cavendishii DSM 21758]|uniref:Uncharacterized protein n=1 Tax=Clostridium cavendishii DSM 21758 TaxID=1121302 RepID=A0A1M6G6I6_9CLOT|nr:hypothetical protein [Clostridium cavendishii]SHJ05588.1 hypothetical protein SAMN02745163_01200 [Clostridium cavendishii DSM 21758]
MNLVSIQYPENKIFNPFDINSTDNYFGQAGGYSYLGNYNDFKDITPWDERSNKMKGEFVLNIFKRHSIFDNGDKIWENSNFNDENDSEEERCNVYYICCDRQIEYYVPSWNSNLKTFNLLNNTTGDISFGGHSWININEALEFAKYYSKEHMIKCMVCKLINSVDRH